MYNVLNSQKYKKYSKGSQGRAFRNMVKKMIGDTQAIFHPGRSKHIDKINNHGKPAIDCIYSYRTLELYRTVCFAFIVWVFLEGCMNLADARAYVPAYLEMRISKNLSAWTVRVDASALAKLYQCSYSAFGVQLPARYREDIVKNVIDMAKLIQYEEKYPVLSSFCRSCGLRRKELKMLRPEDIFCDAQGRVIVHVRQGKGGKMRDVVALNDYPLEVRDQAIKNGKTYLFSDIPSDVPTHVWRKLFAQEVYNLYARPIESLKRSQCYYCLKEMKGIVFDRLAMHEASKRLGHSRLGVMTTYLRSAISDEELIWLLADA